MRGDSMQVPDQVSVRWHIGMQPEEPSLYLISVFAFLPAVYITLCFFFLASPDSVGGSFLFCFGQRRCEILLQMNLGSVREII